MSFDIQQIECGTCAAHGHAKPLKTAVYLQIADQFDLRTLSTLTTKT